MLQNCLVGFEFLKGYLPIVAENVLILFSGQAVIWWEISSMCLCLATDMWLLVHEHMG